MVITITKTGIRRATGTQLIAKDIDTRMPRIETTLLIRILDGSAHWIVRTIGSSPEEMPVVLK